MEKCLNLKLCRLLPFAELLLSSVRRFSPAEGEGGLRGLKPHELLEWNHHPADECFYSN